MNFKQGNIPRLVVQPAELEDRFELRAYTNFRKTFLRRRPHADVDR